MGYLTVGQAYRATATALARLVLVTDALYAFYAAGGDLDRVPRLYVPTPRREVPASARKEVLERDGGCLACGATDDLTVDHVVPLDVGGAHSVTNFQTLCRSCNSAKGIQAVDYRLDA